MSSLGSNIKFLRERHNISPLAMSKKLQISLQDYNAWESGLSLPTITNVMDICAVYGLKNPTDLFSDNFIQIYNSSEIKTVKQVAKRKAEAQKLKEESDAKLTFMIKDGSYYGSTATFNLTIILAIGILVSLFLPSFVVGEKIYIGYLAPWAGILPAVFMYLIAVISVLMIFVGIRGNYRMLAGNEFLPKNSAILLKLAYLFSGLFCAAFALIAYFTTESYEYGLTVVTALSLVYMAFAIMSSMSIKPAKKDTVTYTYVIKFAKYKLRTDKPRKLLKVVSIIGFALAIVCVGLAVGQIIFGKVRLVDEFGLSKGIIAKVSDGFFAMLPHVFGTLFSKIAWAVVAVLVLAVRISNIAVSNKVQKTDYNGYLQDTQTRAVRKHIAINFALDILSYVMAYALIICGLTATVDGTKLFYEYYMLPVLTVVSLLVALRYILYSKVYDAFRGAETYEVTGFSEVKQDEEKRQKKLEKKGIDPNAPQEEKPAKPKKEKKAKKGKGEDQETPAPADTNEGGNK